MSGTNPSDAGRAPEPLGSGRDADHPNAEATAPARGAERSPGSDAAAARTENPDAADPPGTHRAAESPDPADAVVIDNPAEMNLLGLLLGSLIARRVREPALARRLQKLRGDVVVEAGKMCITLRFEPGRLTVLRGASAAPRAHVAGSMDTLLRIALGDGMVGPWLAGRVRTRGNLLLLLRMLPLMRAE